MNVTIIGNIELLSFDGYKWQDNPEKRQYLSFNAMWIR